MLLNLSFHFELVRRFFSTDVDFSPSLSISPTVENEGSGETLSLTSQWLVVAIFHPSLTRQAGAGLGICILDQIKNNHPSTDSIPERKERCVVSGEILRKSLGAIKENEKKSSEQNVGQSISDEEP